MASVVRRLAERYADWAAFPIFPKLGLVLRRPSDLIRISIPSWPIIFEPSPGERAFEMEELLFQTLPKRPACPLGI